MKKGILLPIAVLVLLFGLSLWSSANLQSQTSHWQKQLQQADLLAQSENWTDAAAILAASYQDWHSKQSYLRIILEHDAMDNADCLYQRALAFAAVEDLSEFRAEIAELRNQLNLLAQTESVSLQNIL